MDYISKLTDFLLSPLAASLLATHPNETAVIHPDWQNWWGWAAADRKPLQALLDHYVSLDGSDKVPLELRSLIDVVKTLQLAREQDHPVVPSFIADAEPPSTPQHRCGIPSRGMSPKKSHEVVSMVSFITQLLGSSEEMRNIKHVVDVGAGQGYLSRALQAIGLHVLALDFSDVQARGAERRQNQTKNTSGNGSLTYRTIEITPSTLISSVDDWAASLGPIEESLPVMVVALHACGSLTPDILRASISMIRPQNSRWWFLQSAVVVGCCYNLMSPQEYPLSNSNTKPLHLTSSHLQLAAQVPSTWLDTSSRTLSVKSMGSIRKVAYRAMLEDLLHEYRKTHSENQEIKRLGKLNNKAYTDWKTFLAAVSERLQIESLDSPLDEDKERRLSTLHVLRCLLGPCIESLIVWDRYTWVLQALKAQQVDMHVELVNLFDQNQGSGRNIALVLKS